MSDASIGSTSLGDAGVLRDPGEERMSAAVPASSGAGRVSWRRVGKWVAVCAVLTAGGAAAVLGVRSVTEILPEQSDPQAFSVEAQWNRTISRLGIEPVYPPQEDVAVGDLYAVVVNAEQTDRPQATISDAKPFLGRAVKLAHVPVEREVQTAYAAVPVFPGPAGLAGRDAGGAGDADLFREGQHRTSLPQAAFPGVTISFSRHAGAGVGIGAQGRFGFGGTGESQQTVELRSVETYGLPSIAASEALQKYCAEKSNASVCIEDTARRHLSFVFAPIFEKSFNVNTGEEYYVYQVRIIMIGRVYYAREIVERSMLSSGESGDLAFDAAATSPAPAATPSTTTDGAPTVQRGGIVEYRARDGRGIYLDQKFSRPIAFGYRSVAHEFADASAVKP